MAKRSNKKHQIIPEDSNTVSFEKFARKKKQRYPQALPEGTISIRTPFVTRSPGQEHYVNSLKECTVTLCEGPAGCGKTWIVTYFALEKLLNHEVSKIVVTKPILEAGGEKLGALPGEIEDKTLPHFQSILDCFEDHIGPTMLKKLLDSGKIEFLPTAYCRGRNLHNAFILIDEAQNLTRKGIKLLMTRLAEGSMMVLNGDSDQIDLPRSEDSGFLKAVESLVGKDPQIGVVRMYPADIQRHPLLKVILSNLT